MNVGVSTLVEFLHKKGFADITEDLNQKLTDEEYNLLVAEYSQDKTIREEANRFLQDRMSRKSAADEPVQEEKPAKKEPEMVETVIPEEPVIKFKTVGKIDLGKDKADVKAVKNSIKKVPFDRWPEVLRATFNPDSVIRIRVEKGIFKRGDNALIDREVFKRDTTVTSLEDYPIDAVYGKILKKGPEDYTDVRGLVVADYQEELEREWVAALRRKFTFSVNKDVLKTVNTHN